MQPAAPGGELRDIAYAAGPRHALDIYLPAKHDAAPPIVVFFYGGGWKSGDRAMYRFVGRSLARCGATPRSFPTIGCGPIFAGYAGFLSDAASAVTYARREAVNLGGDPSRLFLMGHSAGGYIRGHAGVGSRVARSCRHSRPAVPALAGMIGLAGPYDFLPLRDPVQEQIFAPVGPRTQPITFAAHAERPLLLVTGANDTTVYPRNSLRLAEQVTLGGGRASIPIVYPRTSAMLALIGALASSAPISRAGAGTTYAGFLDWWQADDVSRPDRGKGRKPLTVVQISIERPEAVDDILSRVSSLALPHGVPRKACGGFFVTRLLCCDAQGRMRLTRRAGTEIFHGQESEACIRLRRGLRMAGRAPRIRPTRH